nr:hypothetical protein [Tanacetum cinerariifolium]
MPVHIIVMDIRTMNMTINQQMALDKALVPHASRLRIGKSNFRLRSDITSKESTLQLVYDVLRLTPFYKAFLVTAYVPKIYMQEFWANATVHHHSIRFKMDNTKQEIMTFLRYLGHSREIKKLTDVNINKLHQPWRSFATVINKCLSGKSTGYDNFVNQVEHKEAKKSNEMYYPRFIKVIIHFFMTKDPSIPWRNKVNWHYVRDDQMFMMIKLVSRHQNTQQFGAILPIELTNEDIRNSAAYKEYYAIASGAEPPKTKAVGSGADEGTSILPGVPDVPTDVSDKEISWKSSDEDDDDDEVDDRNTNNNGDDFVHPKLSIHEEEAKDEESFDSIVQTPKNSDDEGNDDASLGMNIGDKEGHDAEDDDEELYIETSTSIWKEPINYDRHALWGVSHWGRKRQQFYGFAVNHESALDVYSKRRIIAVTELKIVKWHNYKHLDWISIRRDDDKIYKFKEGDFKRLRLQDIEDTLLLLVQGKLSNLNVEERFAFNVSLRMFTRRIVIQSDGTLNDVRNALDDHLKGIRMQYLPTTIWRRGDKDRVAAMIQAIEKMLKTRRIMRSLEKFIGGRLDGTLNDLRTDPDDRFKGIRMKYLPQAIWRRSDKERVASMIQAIDKQL